MVEILLMQTGEGMAVMVVNKVDFRTKKITRRREEHCVVI